MLNFLRGQISSVFGMIYKNLMRMNVVFDVDDKSVIVVSKCRLYGIFTIIFDVVICKLTKVIF